MPATTLPLDSAPLIIDSHDVAGDHVAGVGRGPADGVARAGADILDIEARGVVDQDSDLLARCRSVLNDGTLARGVGADQVALHRVGRGEAAEDVDTGRGVARDEVALAGHVAADLVALRPVDEDADAVVQRRQTVAQRDLPCPVGADRAAENPVAPGAEAGDLHAALRIARDQVGLDEVLGRALDRDPETRVGQHRGPLRIGTDRIAQENVAAGR